MAPHSSTLAWKIPWMEEPGRLHAVHEVTKSRTRLSDFTFTFHFHALEKEMATHSSVLAWRIPGTEEPGRKPVYGVAQSRTRLKRLSSSRKGYNDKNNNSTLNNLFSFFYLHNFTYATVLALVIYCCITNYLKI